MQTIRIIITGKVQGVFFRASARDVAKKLQICGEVRNKSDYVEIIAKGDEERLSQLIEWCHIGPENAVVGRVVVETIPQLEFRDFKIVR